jgi:DNA-3-methyladenine glycosylase
LRPLPRSFFARDTERVARELLGALLVRDTGDGPRAWAITETEAYVGPHDLACHAAKGRTARTEVMFGPPGHAYVYMIYGMYHCLNVVTERADYPAAVLIRGVRARDADAKTPKTDGPGKLCRALSIDRALNRHDLTVGQALWFAKGKAPARIIAGPRVGVDYAGEWAAKPLRFWVPNAS